MTLKAAVVQTDLSTGTGAFNITDAAFSSDKAAFMTLLTKATADKTSTADSVLGIGFSDGTTDVWCGVGADDAVASGDENNSSFTGVCLGRTNGSNANLQVSGTTSGQTHPSDGFRINLTVADVANKLKSAILGGPGVLAKVLTADFTGSAAPETLPVTHGLGATPNVIQVVTIHNATGIQDIRNRMSYGWWIGGSYLVHAIAHSGTTAINVNSYMDTDCIAVQLGTTAGVDYKVTVSAVGATTFSLTATGATTTDRMFIRAMYIPGLEGTLAIINTPTATGNADLFTGRTVAPTYIEALFSRATATGAVSNTDAAGCFGIGVASSSSAQACAVISSDRQASTTSTVEKCEVSNDQLIRILDATGAVDVEAAVGAFGTTTQANFTINASAFKVGIIALSGASAPTFTVAPAFDSATATTLTVDFTTDIDTTVYGVAIPVGASTPTEAQIEAGQNAAGAAAISSDSEATVGGVADALVFAGLDFPVHKFCLVAKASGLYSSIATITSAQKTAATGKQYVTVDEPWDPADESILDGASPAAVDGDIIECDTTTDPAAYALTMNADGTFVIGSGGDSSRQSFDGRFYDISAQAWSDDPAVTIYVNDQPPVFSGDLQDITGVVDSPIPTVDFAALFSDPEGDTITYSISPDSPESLTVGITLDANTGLLAGTSAAPIDLALIVRGTTALTGAFVDSPEFNLIVADLVTVPDVVGETQANAIIAIEAVGLEYDPESRFEYNQDVDFGLVISQAPAATAEVAEGSLVFLVISLGYPEAGESGLTSFGLGFGFGVHA